MTCFARVYVLGRDGVTGLGADSRILLAAGSGGAGARRAWSSATRMMIVFGRDNSKQANGAIGLLTDDLVDREAYYTHAMIMALVPFKNRALSW